MTDRDNQFTMRFLELQYLKLQQFCESLLSPASIFSVPQLMSAFALAFVYMEYRRIKRHGEFRFMSTVRSIFATRLLTHPSTRVDILFFFLNSFVFGGLIAFVTVSGDVVASSVFRGLTKFMGNLQSSTKSDWVLRAGLTIAIFLGYEVGYYLDHYLKHRVPALWEVHKTHHAAEVLTPLTLFRMHPIDSFVFVNIVAVSTGIFYGVFKYAAGKSVDIYAVDGANIITVLFLFTIYHLQHTQIWIPFTGVFGRIIMSPAHHQIHHSIDEAHYNHNFGNCLAILDWIFGTLMMPEKEPQRLRFGILGAGENPQQLKMEALLLNPMFACYKSILTALKSLIATK